jgi:hypothetical protein
MNNLTETTTAKIFLTDYASYNNGTQFEFGHWVDLSDFNDENKLAEYIDNHFAEADKKSPLFGGSREEVMITDYEGLPSGLYSESSMNFTKVYEYLNLDDDDKIKVAFILEQGENIDYALDKFENVYLTEWYENAKYDLFDEWFSDADALTANNDYVTIDYDRFIKENYTEFDFEGTSYLVADNWNC